MKIFSKKLAGIRLTVTGESRISNGIKKSMIQEADKLDFILVGLLIVVIAISSGKIEKKLDEAKEQNERMIGILEDIRDKKQ